MAVAPLAVRTALVAGRPLLFPGVHSVMSHGPPMASTGSAAGEDSPGRGCVSVGIRATGTGTIGKSSAPFGVAAPPLPSGLAARLACWLSPAAELTSRSGAFADPVASSVLAPRLGGRNSAAIHASHAASLSPRSSMHNAHLQTQSTLLPQRRQVMMHLSSLIGASQRGQALAEGGPGCAASPTRVPA